MPAISAGLHRHKDKSDFLRLGSCLASLPIRVAGLPASADSEGVQSQWLKLTQRLVAEKKV
jgi:hypothetical protein